MPTEVSILLHILRTIYDTKNTRTNHTFTDAFADDSSAASMGRRRRGGGLLAAARKLSFIVLRTFSGIGIFSVNTGVSTDAPPGPVRAVE